MANRKRAEARRKAQAKAARRGQSIEGGTEGSAGITINIWAIIGVLILLAIGGVVWATSGDDNSNANNGGTDTNGVNLGDLPTSQPVTVTGEVLFPYDSAAAPDPSVGSPAPILSGFDFQGDAVTIDPSANGPYMIVFLAHWCPHCNAEVPRLLDWKASGGVPPELNVLGVATAVSSSAPNFPPAQWFSDKGWSWPVMVDESTGDGQAGKAAATYGATGWPYFVIVGADGLVKARSSGEITIADLQVLVDDALSA